MRIDKYLIKSGYGTKEIVHQYIKDCLVFVNDKIESDFHYQIKENDVVTISEKIKKYKAYTYIIFNKPDGYISASKDEKDKVIFDLLPEEYNGLNIVGRLDKDTTGLILLTNNNKLYKYLTNPKNLVKKQYKVVFSGDFRYIDQDISKGIILDTGEKTSPFELQFISNSECIITLTEGKFHEVKNIFSALHMKVISLHRISIHNIRLDNLKYGEYRVLEKNEIDSLESLIK